MEYYKSQNDNKSQIISVLEGKSTSPNAKENDFRPEFFLNDLENKIRNIETSINENFEELRCRKCFIENCIHFLILPCLHLICKKCMNFEDYCPVCNNFARILEFPLVVNITERMNSQISDINFIKKMMF